jgi:hypothetical protein
MDFATLTFQRLGLDCDPVPASDAGLELELKKAIRGLKPHIAVETSGSRNL